MTPPTLPDTTVHQLRTGDPAALTLISTYGPYLERAIAGRYRFLSPDDVHDLVVDGLMRCVADGPTFDPDKATLPTWIYRKVEYTVMEFLRRQRHRNRRSSDEIDLAAIVDHRPVSYDGGPSPDMQRLLNQLPAAYRTVLMLYYFEGMHELLIAQQLGANYGTIRTRLCRARAALRLLIEGQCPGHAACAAPVCCLRENG